MNYKPGLLLCPRSRQMVKYEDVKDRVLHYSRLPINIKSQLNYCELIDIPHGQLLPNEAILESIKDE